jgi:hypothetical protein
MCRYNKLQNMHQQLQQQGQQVQQLEQQQQNQRQELVGRIGGITSVSGMTSVVDAQVCSDSAILCVPNKQRKHFSLTRQGLLVQEHNRCA